MTIAFLVGLLTILGWFAWSHFRQGEDLRAEYEAREYQYEMANYSKLFDRALLRWHEEDDSGAMRLLNQANPKMMGVEADIVQQLCDQRHRQIDEEHKIAKIQVCNNNNWVAVELKSDIEGALGKLRVREVHTGGIVDEYENMTIEQFSENGNFAVVTTRTGQGLLDLIAGGVVRSEWRLRGIKSITNDGKRVLTTDRIRREWIVMDIDTMTSKRIAFPADIDSTFHDAILTPDGKSLMFGPSTNRERKENKTTRSIHIWSLENTAETSRHTILDQYQDNPGSTFEVRLLPDGSGFLRNTGFQSRLLPDGSGLAQNAGLQNWQRQSWIRNNKEDNSSHDNFPDKHLDREDGKIDPDVNGGLHSRKGNIEVYRTEQKNSVHRSNLAEAKQSTLGIVVHRSIIGADKVNVGFPSSGRYGLEYQISPDGRYLASLLENGELLRIVKLPENQTVFTASSANPPVYRLFFDSNRSVISTYVNTRDLAEHRDIYSSRWDVRSGHLSNREKQSLQFNSEYQVATIDSANGKLTTIDSVTKSSGIQVLSKSLLCSRDRNAFLRYRNPQVDPNCLYLQISDMASSSRTSRMAFCGSIVDETGKNNLAGVFEVWDLKSNKMLVSKKTPKQLSDPALNCIAVSPDGRWVASGSAAGDVVLYEIDAVKEGFLLAKQAGEIAAIRFHPTETLLAIGTKDGLVVLYDFSRHVALREFMIPRGQSVMAVEFPPAGKHLLTCGGGLRVWDLSTGKSIREIPDTDWCRCVAVDPLGRFIVAGGGKTTESSRQVERISSWDADTFAPLIGDFGHSVEGPIRRVTFPEPDKVRFFASGSQNTRAWDLASQKSVDPASLIDSITNNAVLTSSHFDTAWQKPDLIVRERASGREVGRVRNRRDRILDRIEPIFSLEGNRLTIFPDFEVQGQLERSQDLASTSVLLNSQQPNAIQIFDWKTGQELLAFAPQNIKSMRTSSNGGVIATYGYENRNAGQRPGEEYFSLFQLYPPELVRTIRGHQHSILGLDFTRDSNRILSYSKQSDRREEVAEAKLSEVGSGKEIATFTLPNAISHNLILDSDGTSILGTIRTQTQFTLHSWDAKSGKEQKCSDSRDIEESEIERTRGQSKIELACTPDNRIVAMLTDHELILADRKNLTMRQSIDVGSAVHSLPDNKLRFDLTGSNLYLADRQIRIKMPTLTIEPNTESFSYPITFRNDGYPSLMIGQSGSRSFFSTTSSQTPTNDRWFNIDSLHMYSLSLDSRSLAYTDNTGNVFVYSLDPWLLTPPGTPKLLRVLRGHMGKVNCLKFSPDGRYLATGGEDRTIKLWDMSMIHPK